MHYCLYFLIFVKNLSYKNIFILIYFKYTNPSLDNLQNTLNKKNDLSNNNYVNETWSSEIGKIERFKSMLENKEEINLIFI